MNHPPYRSAAERADLRLSLRTLLLKRHLIWFALVFAGSGFALVRALSQPEPAAGTIAPPVASLLLSFGALLLLVHRTSIHVDMAAGVLVVRRIIPLPPRRVVVELRQIARLRAETRSGRGRVVAELHSGEEVLLFLVQEARLHAVMAKLEQLREASAE